MITRVYTEESVRDALDRAFREGLVAGLVPSEAADAVVSTIVAGMAPSDGASASPIPMRLVCPECRRLHIDEGEFATKVHHTHSCQHCGLTWRPAVVATVGVRFLPGFKNE